jgi:tetratricopeptide (TPR) repeat protein
MSFFGKWCPILLAAAFWVAAAGCSQMDQGPADEEKEPHYVLGKSRVNAFNYPGAIEAFEESLEANPHSAQAHYQLAMLYDNQVSDPAAAIYHYQQYLKYDPRAENGDAVAGRIAACKQQLATDVLQLPSAPAVQQQLEKLTEENRRLHEQLAQWQAYYEAQQAAAKTNPPIPRSSIPTTPTATSLTPEDITPATTVPTTFTTTTSTTGAVANTHRATTPRTGIRSRTHIVAGGETLASIARKEGIADWHTLEEANPGVNPRKLKAGQVLNVPAP